MFGLVSIFTVLGLAGYGGFRAAQEAIKHIPIEKTNDGCQVKIKNLKIKKGINKISISLGEE